MKISEKGKKLIQEFEGCELEAYRDSVGVITIGYGNTFYEDGSKVKEGDVITQDRADSLLKIILLKFEVGVSNLVKKELSDNQFSALVSFAYNVGLQNLKSSTLLQMVNKKPSNKNIAVEFSKWNRAGGKILDGLKRRRKAESDLYFEI